MDVYTIALFGEAERGNFRTAYFCKTLTELDELFGNPPPESRGLYYAVQALMYQRQIIFFRVPEEGFSQEDYLWGLHELEKQDLMVHISALCLPGVGDDEVIQAIKPVCAIHNAIFITNEADLYDYLTKK